MPRGGHEHREGKNLELQSVSIISEIPFHIVNCCSGEDVKLRDLGERRAIDSIRKILQGEGADVGQRQDDCAVMDFGGEYLLLTTDMISKATHIPDAATPWQMGWHAAAVNLSDIAAMGGEPMGLVASLGVPRDHDEEMLLALMEGMDACATTFETSIVGGDTKEAEHITIAGCALGRVEKPNVMFRRGANIGDVIAVTGELGRTAAAFHALQGDPGDGSAVKNLLEILPRIREGRALGKTRAATSCMDISDGLSSSIYQMSRLNGTGYTVEFEKLPIAEEARETSKRLNVALEELALYYGGDYELLFTVKEGEWNRIEETLKDTGARAARIGRVTKEIKNILIKDGVLNELDNRGFEHFR